MVAKKKKKISWLKRRSSSRTFFGLTRTKSSRSQNLGLYESSSNGEVLEATYDRENRDDIDKLRKDDTDDSMIRSHPPITLLGAEEEDDDDDDDDCHVGYLTPTNIYNDQPLYSFGPLEKMFINNILTKLQLMGLGGYNNQKVGNIIGTNLHQLLCAHDLPFNSLRMQCKEVDDDDNGNVYQLSGRTFDAYPLCTYIEHYLRSRTGANDANYSRDDVLGTNPIAMSIVKSSICELLRELNINLRIHDSYSNDWKRDTKETRNRAWENPPFANIWNSLGFAVCFEQFGRCM